MDKSMIAVSAFALTGLSLSLILKQYNKEFAIIISAITSIFLLISVMDNVRTIWKMLCAYLDKIESGGLYLSVMSKVLITAYITDFTVQLCKDAGESSIASKVELAGKIMTCLIASPVLLSILELISLLLSP